MGLLMVTPSAATLPNYRARLAAFIESKLAVRVITALILLNAVTLGLETDPDIMARWGVYLQWTDRTLLTIFTLELTIKLVAYRFSFFRSGWNVFDFIIVSVSWLPASGTLSVLRAFRILRVLRLLSVVPQMRRVITALGHSIPGMSSVIGVLLIIFYVCAVLSTKLFGQHPDPQMQEWFGTVGASAYTLFQIMTLESWSMGIVRPTMEYFPLSWIFFVPFIIITSFAVLNLFIGIIVDAMQMAQEPDRQADKAEMKSFTQEEVSELMERLQEMSAEVSALHQKLDRLAAAAPTPFQP